MQRLKFLASFLVIVLFGATTVMADENRIALKLFGKNVVEDYDGCRFALWQKNRDPDTDTYAYVFYAPIPDAEPLPGWMQIGDTIFDLERIDQGSDGGMLDAHQLYRSSDGKLNVIMDINEQQPDDYGIAISDAYLTIIMDGKFPFGSRVKGMMGCPAHSDVATNSSSQATELFSELPGDPITLSAPQNFDSFDAVPPAILRHIRQNMAGECDLDQSVTYASRYAISDAMSLWELPCMLYARNASSVFFTILDAQPDYFAPLFVQPVPQSGDSERHEILNANVRPEFGEITSYSYYGPTNSCGYYESHHLRAVEGEAIELFLLEVREKQDCDDTPLAPEQFPVTYSAQ